MYDFWMSDVAYAIMRSPVQMDYFSDFRLNTQGINQIGHQKIRHQRF